MIDSIFIKNYNFVNELSKMEEIKNHNWTNYKNKQSSKLFMLMKGLTLYCINNEMANT